MAILAALNIKGKQKDFLKQHRENYNRGIKMVLPDPYHEYDYPGRLRQYCKKNSFT